jgi:hypothetical protein
MYQKAGMNKIFVNNKGRLTCPSEGVNGTEGTPAWHKSATNFTEVSNAAGSAATVNETESFQARDMQ